jgi:ABC-type branched-subunit amino acid transport system ATPase component
MLKVENVFVAYGRSTAVREASLTVNEKEIVREASLTAVDRP